MLHSDRNFWNNHNVRYLTAGLSWSFESTEAFIFTTVTNLLPFRWIVSTIVQFTCNIKGPSNILSHSRCHGFQPLTRALKSNFPSRTFFGSLLRRGFFQSCYLNLNRRHLFRWFCLLSCFLWFWFFFAFNLVFRFIFHFLFFGFFWWWFSFLGWWFNLLFLLWRLKENENGNCSHTVCSHWKSASTLHSLNNEIFWRVHVCVIY